MKKIILIILCCVISLVVFLGFCYQAEEEFYELHHNFEYGSRIYDYCNNESDNYKLKLDYKIDGAGEFYYKPGDLNASIKDCSKEILSEFSNTIMDVYVSNLMDDEDTYKEAYHTYRNKDFEKDYEKRKALGVTNGVGFFNTYEYAYIYKTNEGVIVQIVPFHNIHEERLENRINNEILVNEDTYLRPNYDGIRGKVKRSEEAGKYQLEVVEKVNKSKTIMVKIGEKIKGVVEFFYENPKRENEKDITIEVK